MSESGKSGKRIFTEGISKSLDTVLVTTLGTTYHNRLKKSNPNLLKSEKSLSNNSSKSSSGSSLTTLTNNPNHQSSANCINNQLNQYPHHQFYCSQISTSANWNNSARNSIHSQKVIKKHNAIKILSKKEIVLGHFLRHYLIISYVSIIRSLLALKLLVLELCSYHHYSQYKAIILVSHVK
jgi:hypothetical protein